MGPDPRNPGVYVYIVTQAPTCAGRRYAVDVKPPVTVPIAGMSAFPIIWHVKTNGYSFVQNNKIDDPYPLEGSQAGEINSCRAGGNTMQCTNNAKNRGKWKYDLHLVSADSCKVDYDPIISNE